MDNAKEKLLLKNKLYEQDFCINEIKKQIDNGNTYLEIFNEVKAEVYASKSKYDADKDNYSSLLIFYFIKNEIPLEDFVKVIKSYNFSKSLDRFFNLRDYDNTSIWDKMIDEFVVVKGEIKLKDKNLKYFYALFENVKSENLLDFYSSRIADILAYNLMNSDNIVDNINKIKELIKLDKFQIEEERNFRDLFGMVLRDLSSELYNSQNEDKIDKVKNIINIFLKEEYFENYFKEKIIFARKNVKYSDNKYDISLEICNFLKHIDRLDILYESYNNIMGTIKDEEEKINFNNAISSGIYVSFKDNQLQSKDIKIDMTKGWVDNWLGLIFLSYNKDDSIVIKEIVDYVNNQNVKIEKNWAYDYNFKLLFTEDFIKKIKFYKMQNDIDVVSTKTIKKKI